MPQYIIKWDMGLGESYLEVDAKDKKEALELSYKEAEAEFNENVVYSVIGIATDKLRDEFSIDEE